MQHGPCHRRSRGVRARTEDCALHSHPRGGKVRGEEFDALLSQKTRVSQDSVDRLRDELRAVVGSYASAASFRAENQLSEVEGRLA